MTPLISKWTFSGPWRTWAWDPGRAEPAIGADSLLQALASVVGTDLPLEGVRLSDALPFDQTGFYLPGLPDGPGLYERPDGQPAALTGWQGVRFLQGRPVAYCQAPAEAGLYILMDLADDQVRAWDDAWFRLSLAGIGARRSLGWGQFNPSPLRPLDLAGSAAERALALALTPVEGAGRLLSTVIGADLPAEAGLSVRPLWRGTRHHPDGPRLYWQAGSRVATGPAYTIGNWHGRPLGAMLGR
ncbi:hypothetical protein ACKQTC_00650 [Peptococcus simiae]|uniref:Uncharacterized protein n=1 Tax=Peptococcus simiae TaxID=1643805 RepID=A0ABW9GY74_9FIRM